jgi:23S rRNA (guanosine2251-2'-O)-methyltransferase
MSEKIIILDNVRSSYNVGAIFRTADGAGVTEVLLLGYSPTPIDRFGRPNPKIVKTSLGASATVPWRSIESLSETLEAVARLQRSGFTIVAVEQVARSTKLDAFTVPDKVAYIVGNEIAGVRSELLGVADAVLEIPLLGKKESLNVSVTAGIVLFR